MTLDLDLDCPWTRLLECLRAPASFSRHVVLSGAWPPAAKFEAAAEMGSAKSGSPTIFVEFVWHNAQGPSVFGADFERSHGQALLIDAHANYRRLSSVHGARDLVEKMDELLRAFGNGQPDPQAFDRWLLSIRRKG